MRILCTSFLILICGITSFAQNFSVNTLSHDWVMSKGWFGDEQVEFTRLDTARQKSLVQVYSFRKDATLATQLYNPQHLGLCGNGLLYMNNSSWVLYKNDILFNVSGGRFADSEFHYIMTYSIVSIADGKMILKKKEVQLNENKRFGN